MCRGRVLATILPCCPSFGTSFGNDHFTTIPLGTFQCALTLKQPVPLLGAEKTRCDCLVVSPTTARLSVLFPNAKSALCLVSLPCPRSRYLNIQYSIPKRIMATQLHRSLGSSLRPLTELPFSTRYGGPTSAPLVTRTRRPLFRSMFCNCAGGVCSALDTTNGTIQGRPGREGWVPFRRVELLEV